MPARAPRPAPALTIPSEPPGFSVNQRQSPTTRQRRRASGAPVQASLPRYSRRQALRAGVGALAGLAGAALLGCAEDGNDNVAPAAATAVPTTPREAAGTAAPPPTAATPGVAAPSRAARATWRRIEASGERPSARRDHALVADAEGKRAFLHGGRDSSGQRDDLWTLEVDTATWRRVQPSGAPPAARFGHNLVYDAPRERLVLFGGQAGATFFADSWAYDIRANGWTQLLKDGAGPRMRYGAGGTLEPGGQALLVTHGFTNQGRFDDTWRHVLGGPAAWSELSPASGERPLRRCLLRTVDDPQRGRVLLFGGQSNEQPFMDDLWTFEVTARRWQRLAATSAPSPRNLYSWVRREDAPAAVLFGGQTREGPANDVLVLDLATGRWQSITPEGAAPPARAAHDAAWLSARRSMLVVGGTGTAGNVDDVWELSFA